MIVTDDDLFTLASTVWTSMLGMDLERAADVDGKIGEAAITSCVQITGDWEGAVTVSCSMRLAGEIAASMFDMEASELSDDEIRDAMGEIANMTGGSVKGLAPGDNTLALPTVAEGDESTMSIPRTRQVNRVVGVANEQPVVVTVLGRAD